MNNKHLKERAAIIQAVRSFFIGLDYLEVETPVRIPALAPEAYIEPQESGNWFLQTSPELCMKRLLTAGLPRIFQICKCFRKGERGRLHLPEMTMLEWYTADNDYNDLMTDCENLLQAVQPPSSAIDLAPPWHKISVSEAFHSYAPVSCQQALRDDNFDEILVKYIEPHLGFDKPTFLYNYPAALASLAALLPENPELAQRFELYIAGVELANGFTELNNATEQRQRFSEEQELIRKLGRTPTPMPETFLKDLHKMPRAAGIALGIDRLVMLLTGAESIDDTVAFTPENA
jgi:lysyl-tRNA synthetase class 2